MKRMTKAERKAIAERLREVIAESDKQGEDSAFRLGWLKGGIEVIAEYIEAGRFPGKEEA